VKNLSSKARSLLAAQAARAFGYGLVPSWEHAPSVSEDR
jgi:hypothetical protein